MGDFASEGRQHAGADHAATPAPSTPGRSALHAPQPHGGAAAGTEVASDQRDHSTPPVLGRAADAELRTLLANLRRDLATHAHASTEAERDAAIDQIDVRVHLAFDHVPAVQHEAFRGELRSALGADDLHALAEMQPRGRSIRQYLGHLLPTIAPPAPPVSATEPQPPTPSSPAADPTSDLATKLVEISGRISLRDATPLVQPLQAAMASYHIDSPAQQAMFIAQTMNETGGYHTFVENREDPEAFYGVHSRRARGLGNTEVGDGARFVGRGAMQITGRAAYAAAARRMHMPELLEHPELAAGLDLRFRTAADYWTARVVPARSWFEQHRHTYDWSWIPNLENRHLPAVSELATGLAYDYCSLAINPGIPVENLGRRHEWYSRAAPLFGLTDEGVITVRERS